MNYRYTLTQTRLTITPDVTIRQYVVDNSSPFYLFINESSKPPDTNRYDLLVPPHSCHVSENISINGLSVYAPNFVHRQNYPKISVYDSAVQDVYTSPINRNQFTIFPGYPIVGVVIPNTTEIVLPDLFIDTYDVIAFIASWDRDEQDDLPRGKAPLLVLTDSSGFEQVIGGFTESGGVVTYTPSIVPSLYTPKLRFVENPQPVIGSFPDITINTLRVSRLCDSSDLSTSKDDWRLMGGITPADNFQICYPANPPGFIISIWDVVNEALSVTIDLDILYPTGFTSIFSYTFDSTRQVGKFLVYPRLVPVAEHGVARLTGQGGGFDFPDRLQVRLSTYN